MDTDAENNEIRMTIDETNPNHELVVGLFQLGMLSEFTEAPCEHSSFVIPSSFDIRAWSFFLRVHSCSFVVNQ
jgi:hypothetical protein